MTSGGKKDPVYLDDVFSTYLYYGNCPDNNLNTTQTITNGIDLAGEGGLVWLKHRTGLLGSAPHALVDTERGANKTIYSNSTQAEDAYDDVNAFYSNGFQLKGQGNAGCSNYGQGSTTTAKYASWSWRKQKGFFDIVTYTGNGTAGRTVSHSLGCEPGMIIIKNLDSTEDWRVYHRSLGGTHNLVLNSTAASAATSSVFNQTDPTASVFTVGTSDATNKNGDNFVAYIFAGGESTAATARSVFFDGASDHMRLSLDSSTDLDMGTGDFTIEFWYNYKNTNTSNRQAIISSNTVWGSGFTQIQVNHPSHINHILLWDYDINSSNPVLKSTNTFPNNGTWRHVAISRSGSALKMFVNGTLENSVTQTGSLDFSDSYGTYIGYYPSNTGLVADISNLRVVKGTAVYTESFRPPTEPLTAITNTKLLCCNNSSVTGATVTPGTITAIANPTATTDSPFDDPEGFKFGEGGDQNIIKTGSYVGNGSSSAPPSIYLGWEPQWVMVKRTNGSGGQDWVMVDSMRGMYRGESTMPHLRANSTNLEQDTSYYRIDVSSGTGFAPFTTDNGLNGNGDNYIYIALRRPDGLVGKPLEVGTDAFAMDTGAGAGAAFGFDSGFPVDLALRKQPASTDDWYIYPRLTTGKALKTNSTAAESAEAEIFDSNVGWAYDYGSNYQAWMWKRHAGFDCIAYQGSYAAADHPHSLGKVPEMYWIKKRNGTAPWRVYHKGVNGGSNPEEWYMELNSAAAQSQADSPWFAPTSTHLRLKSNGNVQWDNTFIAMLFASVDGISKLGNWVGDGGTQTITLGFQPRFLLLKTWNTGGGWYMLDTRRGWGAGNDASLQLQEGNAQVSSRDDGAPTATGFTVTGDVANEVGRSYIYYAHA